MYTNGRGGARPGSGRKKLRYTLDADTAKLLDELILDDFAKKNRADPDATLRDIIRDAYERRKAPATFTSWN